MGFFDMFKGEPQPISNELKEKIIFMLSDKLLSSMNGIIKNDFIDNFEINTENKEELGKEMLYLTVFYADYCWYNLRDNPFSDSELYEIMGDVLNITIAKYFTHLGKINSIQDISNPNIHEEADELRETFKSRRKEYNQDLNTTEGLISFGMSLNSNIRNALDLDFGDDNSSKVGEISPRITEHLSSNLAEFLYENIRPLR